MLRLPSLTRDPQLKRCFASLCNIRSSREINGHSRREFAESKDHRFLYGSGICLISWVYAPIHLERMLSRLSVDISHYPE
jgi:hypothetical protein